MKQRGNRLLMDLAGIVKRHPSREWFRLASLLENDVARAQIIAFLKDIAALRRSPESARAKPKPRKQSTALPGLDNLERLELDLAQAPLQDLRGIAKGYGLPFSTKDSRQRLMKRIMRAASGNVTSKDARSRTTAKREDRGNYERWADIIIGGKRPRA